MLKGHTIQSEKSPTGDRVVKVKMYSPGSSGVIGWMRKSSFLYAEMENVLKST